MKKRLTAILLTVCLLSGMLSLPAKAANKAAWQYLVSYAQSSGGNARSVQISHSTNSSEYFIVAYDSTTNSIRLVKSVSGGQYIKQGYRLEIVIPSSLKAPYTLVQSQTIDGDIISTHSFSFDPASFTQNTKLDYISVVSDPNNVVSDILELTGLVLYDGGYTLKDLGFLKFNRHTIHNAGPSRVTKQPTCADYGELTTYCAICGAPVLTSRINPTGIHTWNQGQVILPPTCVNDGWATYTCTVCGTGENRTLPATGKHTWNEGKVKAEPTCTEDGLTRYTCTVCKNTKDVIVPALGHLWKLFESVEQGPSAHETTEKYVCERCQEVKEARLCAAEIFTDMPEDDNYAHDAIDWAYFHEPQITAGASATAFSPKNTCTRGQVVTFLWRAAGKPELDENDSPETLFEDVPEDAYYFNAVLWAVKNGVTTGVSATRFNPGGKCTRAQVVTFLWRAAGEPALGEYDSYVNPFEDVPENAYYCDAVLWALNRGVTTGASAVSFNPGGKCTRAQVVTFLYRAFAENN